MGHETLKHYGSVEGDKYVMQNHKTSQRSFQRWADYVIPRGHLEDGGIVIVAINYPTNMHWIWGGLTGWNPPVLEIRTDSMTKDDTWAIVGSTFMANSVLQVRYVMSPFHSSSDIMHTQILKPRYPALDRITVNRKRCVHHPGNACGLHVIAQTMLFAEGKEKTHRVTKTMVQKLRFFIINYLREHEIGKYSLPKWP